MFGRATRRLAGGPEGLRRGLWTNSGAGPKPTLVGHRPAAAAAVAATAAVLAGVTLLREPSPKAEELVSVMPAVRRQRVNSRPRKLAGNVHYEYVICGSGTAAYTALEVIRQTKPGASVLLISSEYSKMARPDVDFAPEQMVEELQDVYNEWRRHITAKLGFEEPTHYIGTESGSAGSNMRKWSTRRGAVETEPSQAKGGAEPVTILVEDSASVQIHAEDKTITLSDGSELSYDKCLLAPPGNPRELYVLRSSISFTLKDKINLLKDVQDFKDLQRVMSDGGRRIVVIGGGFLGTSLCSALLEMNKQLPRKNSISQTFVEAAPLQQYFPDYLCQHIMSTLSERGLEVHPDRLVTAVTRSEEVASGDVHATEVLAKDGSVNTPAAGLGATVATQAARAAIPAAASAAVAAQVERAAMRAAKGHEDAEEEEEEEEEEGEDAGQREAASPDDEKVKMTLTQGTYKELLECDYVVLASTNVTPDVEIARRSNLEIDPRNGGIMCNSSLEAYSGLFVAGSSASYHDPALGRRRVDCFDNALNSGLLAGQNMVTEDGRPRRYNHQPTFRCALAGTGFAFDAVGHINSNYSTIGLWLARRDPRTGKPLKDTAFERGIVFYVRNNTVVGILCCNASECLDSARDTLREGLTVEEAKQRLMLAPEKWIRVYHTR